MRNEPKLRDAVTEAVVSKLGTVPLPDEVYSTEDEARAVIGEIRHAVEDELRKLDPGVQLVDVYPEPVIEGRRTSAYEIQIVLEPKDAD